jgi:hypothetical protein
MSRARAFFKGAALATFVGASLVGCAAVFGVGDLPPLVTSEASADAEPDAGVNPFEVVHSLPEGPTLASVWGLSDENMFAVGGSGVKYMKTATSQGWLRTTTSPGRDYTQVWGTGANDVYVVGIVRGTAQGIIEHYDGTNWTDEYLAPTSLNSIWSDGFIVLAVGASGFLYGKQSGTKDWASRGRITTRRISVTSRGRSRRWTRRSGSCGRGPSQAPRRASSSG